MHLIQYSFDYFIFYFIIIICPEYDTKPQLLRLHSLSLQNVQCLLIFIIHNSIVTWSGDIC